MAASSSSSAPAFQASSMAQGQTVEFDSSYKEGTVYVMPDIIKSRVKVFKKTKEKAPQDPLMPRLDQGHAMVADQAKIDNAKANLKGEEAELYVVTMLYEQLQKKPRPGDPPVFIFTSLKLEGCEKDVIVFHEKLGILVVEIKAIEDIGTAAAPRGDSTLVKAADQLKNAREAVTSELQGLLARPPSLLVALPNLQGTDPQDVRQRVRFFRDNPDVAILCGREAADYEAWLHQLSSRPDPLVWEAQPDSHQAFVTAVSKHLSVPRYSPTQTASDLAQHHRSWLLTPDQAPVLHCHDRLLHLWGPPGAGKTLLLLHRVRLWLQSDKYVFLCVGDRYLSVLLQHLGRATVSAARGDSSRLALCRYEYNFLSTVEKLGQRVSPDHMCVVVDEVESYFLSTALTALKRRQISCLWTASVQDIPHTESAQFSTLGGEKVLLLHSLRCPAHVVEVAGHLQGAGPGTPAMTAFPCLPARLATASAKVLYHPSHPHYRAPRAVPPHFDCGDCSQWLESSLSPLVEGLPLQDEQWRHWVIVCTGDVDTDRDVIAEMAAWLRRHGVPAAWEGESHWDSDYSNLPVSVVEQASRGQGSQVRNEEAAWRERVVSGEDRDGHIAVHFVPSRYFTGMEKPFVLVLHWDGGDDHPDFQMQAHREDRERRHRKQLFVAVTRCQAELAILFLSPSPAASCLPQVKEAADAAEEEILRKKEESREKEEERRREQEEEWRRVHEAAARVEKERRKEAEIRRKEEERQREQEEERRQVKKAAEEERQRKEEERQRKEEEERQRKEEEKRIEQEEWRRRRAARRARKCGIL